MNLADVMDEIAEQLRTIPDLRVYAYPPDNIQIPAAVVDLPQSINYDVTYGRGMDRMMIPVAVLVGRVDARTSRDAIAPFFDGSGSRSIKTVIEAGTYQSFDASSLRVAAAEDPFEVWTVANVAYLAGVFTLDISGEGA